MGWSHSDDKLHHKCDQGDGDWCPGHALGKCLGSPSPVSLKSCSHRIRWPSCWEFKLEWIQWNSHHQEYQDHWCLRILCDNCESRNSPCCREAQCDDPAFALWGWFPTSGPDGTKCLYQAGKGTKNVIVVVRNNTAYAQTLRKKTPVARAVMVTCIPEPPVQTGLTEVLEEDYSHQAPKLTVKQRQAKFFEELCILILGPLPGSWVIRVLTLWAASLMKCVRYSVWRNCRPCLTTPKLIGWWRGHTKPWSEWLGSWERTKRLTGQDTWLR